MIKRIVSMLIVILFSCGSIAFANEVETRPLENGEVFLNDTFEYQLDNTTPSGYTVVRNGNNCTLKTENRNNAISCSYNQNQTSTRMRFDKNFGYYFTGQLVMECKVSITSENANVILFSSKSSINSWKAQIVAFSNDGKIYFCGEEFGTYAKNTTYHIVLFFDMIADTVKGKINSVDAPEKSFLLDDIKAIRFEADFSSDYEVLFDDIRIYGGNKQITSFSEPTYNKNYAIVSNEVYNSIFKRPDEAVLVARLDNSRPRILLNNTQIDTLKSIYSTDVVAKEYIDGILKVADAEIPKRPVGYNDAAARTVAQRIKNRVGILGVAYLYTKDEKYATRLWEETENFCSFSDWFPTDHLTHAEFLYSSAFAYDWLYTWFEKNDNKEKKEFLYNALIDKGISRCKQVYDVAAYGYTSTWASLTDNISAVCNGGVICACLALLEKENNNVNVVQCLEFSIKALEGFLENFAPDGGWHEGFTYASYAIRYFTQALLSLEYSYGEDFGLSKAPGFSEATDFYIYLTAPGGIFNFHDCEWYYRRAASEMYYFANKFDKPYLGYYATKFRKESGSSVSFLDLIFYKGGYENTDITLDKYFEGIETAMFRSDESYLGVHAGKVGVTHGEFDAGNFVFDALGERFIEDLGPDSYSLTEYNTVRDDFPYYRRRAEGHNTLVINPSLNAGQSTSGVTKITSFESNPKSGKVIMDLTSAYAAYNADSVLREFSYDRERQSVTITDDISCVSASEIYSFLHTKADIEIMDNKKEAILTKNGKCVKVTLLSPINAELSQMDAVPLETSPVREGQNANEGVKKLFVHLKDVENVTITLKIAPFGDILEDRCCFDETDGKVSVTFYPMLSKKVFAVLAGYDASGNLSFVDILEETTESDNKLYVGEIQKTDLKDYKLFVSYNNELYFKIFSKEVD